jgi:DNA-binding transcriptional LysR family regulator
MDRLTSLTAFVQVVDSGGFSAAGRRLNMSTTMVSNHIQALEDRLGARLLNRTTRKVSLTEVGKAYYDRCTQILAEIEQADEVAGALQTAMRDHRRYAYSVWAASLLRADMIFGKDRGAPSLRRWPRTTAHIAGDRRPG